MVKVQRRTDGWRTVDIVVTAIVAVAFGVVFWAWDLLFGAIHGVFAAFPPAQGLVSGVWVMPAVIGALVIRKPGAAVYCEMVAALVEALLGNQWGLTVLLDGFLEGLGPEIVFAVLAYRRWGLPSSLAAGAAAGLGAAVYENFAYYPTWSLAWKGAYTGTLMIGGLAVAGLGGWYLVRALARTGALSPFPSARR